MATKTDATLETPPTTEKKATVNSPPLPPKSQTIIIPTVSPELIPNEDATAYCFTRRNMFDIVIGLILAIGIIYFVMYTGPGGPGFTGFSSMFSSKGSSGILGTGTSAETIAKPVAAGTIGSGIGQMGGFLKRLFR